MCPACIATALMVTGVSSAGGASVFFLTRRRKGPDPNPKHKGSVEDSKKETKR